MSDKPELITPIEYVRDNYNQRLRDKEVVVWYDDQLVTNVWERNGRYKLITNDGTGDNNEFCVRPYESCLRVEPYNPQTWRQECQSAIDQLPDERMLRTLLVLRLELRGWQETLAFHQTVEE
jgi:hypothetical protein